jgi:hypothetical protein
MLGKVNPLRGPVLVKVPFFFFSHYLGLNIQEKEIKTKAQIVRLKKKGTFTHLCGWAVIGNPAQVTDVTPHKCKDMMLSSA